MNDNNSPPRSDWILPAILFCIIVCSGAGYVIFDGPITPADKPADKAPLPTQTGIVQFELVSGITPYIESDEVSTVDDVIDISSPTPHPTRTPEPIVISDNVQNSPVIRYKDIEVTRVVIVEVIQEVSPTPQPSATPVPTGTPNAAATVSADLHRQDMADRKLARTWAWVASLAVWIFLVILLARIFYLIGQDWLDSKMAIVEDVPNVPEMSTVDGVTAEQYRTIRLMKAQGKHSDTAIQVEAFGYAWGSGDKSSGQLYKNVLDELDKEGEL